eukprot:TRINITY_DN7235_c0_g1_i1.p1 TRINITY_DN7235_c0_g1~~TRINITY_DN7235_c0_g1_i1.p1  ORF type:complete len:294 (+),score=71.65 TRINITY_DN7235_c0_g1_i1:101-982(+)
MEEFTRHLAKITICQICKSFGFESIQASALETLCDVFVKYIEEIGYSAHIYAEHANRTDVNFHDVCLALSEANSSITELINFLSISKSLPYPYKKLPKFSHQDNNFAKRRELRGTPEEFPRSIPPIFPPFPEKHTYIFSPAIQQPSTDKFSIQKHRNKRKRQIESSLTHLNELSQKKEKDTTNNNNIDSFQDDHIIQNPYLQPPKEKPENLKHVIPTTKIKPKLNHISYLDMDKQIAVSDDLKNRIQKTGIDLEDEIEKARKIQKCKRVLQHSEINTVTTVGSSLTTHQLELE